MTTITDSISDNLAQVKAAIRAAEKLSNRHTAVQLLAVSKTKPAVIIEQAYQAGQRLFGENYVQEGVEKVTQLQHLQDIEWHFIGPIQSNKTRDVAQHFAWVHSIDRLKIARRLAEQRPANIPPLQVLIQVNIDDEASKAGVQAAELAALASDIAKFPQLTLRGLMTIPAAQPTAAAQEQSMAAMYGLFSDLQTQYKTVDTLSMGMSNDMQVAIAHGATLVRIGTAIFGARSS